MQRRWGGLWILWLPVSFLVWLSKESVWLMQMSENWTYVYLHSVGAPFVLGTWYTRRFTQRKGNENQDFWYAVIWRCELWSLDDSFNNLERHNSALIILTWAVAETFWAEPCNIAGLHYCFLLSLLKKKIILSSDAWHVGPIRFFHATRFFITFGIIDDKGL